MRMQIALSVLAICIVFLAAMSEAPLRETNLVRVAAAVAVVAALSSWLKPRFVRYGMSMLFLTMAVGALLSNDYSRTTSGWVSKVFSATYMLYFAFSMGRRAWRTTVIYGPSWNTERNLVQNWLGMLTTPHPLPAIVEFDSVSFWTGHFTYRLLNAKSCWIVAKFKRGDVGAMRGCRVYGPEEVQQVGIGETQFSLALGRSVIRGFRATPDMQSRLSTSLSTK